MYAQKKSVDNVHIVRERDRQRFRELFAVLALGIPIGLFLLLTRNLRHLAKLRIVSSTVVFFLLAAPWHVLAAIRNPAQGQSRGFLWFYFINEHINRFLNKRVPSGYDTVPLFLFWALLVLWHCMVTKAMAKVQKRMLICLIES